MIRDIGTVLRGTLFAQIIGVVALPILSRLFDPAAFGHFAIYQAVVLLLGIVACLRYDQAIVAAATEPEALALFQLCFVIAAALSGVSSVVALICAAAGLKLGFPLLIFVPATFVAGMVLASGALLTRLSAFRQSANNRIAQSVTTAGVSVGCGIVAPSASGLIVGDLAGKSAAIVLVFAYARRTIGPVIGVFDRQQVRVAARKFRDFPKFSVLGGLLNNGAQVLTPMAAFWIYGATVAGQFAMVNRAIALPIGLIVIAVSQVFSAHLARLLRESPAQAPPYFRQVVKVSLLVGLAPMVAGIALAPWAFEVFLGAKWAAAGRFAQILAITYYSSAVAGPVTATLLIGKQLKWQLRWEAVQLTGVAAIWASAAWAGLRVEITLAGYAAVMTITNFWFVWIAYSQLLAAAEPMPRERTKDNF